MYGVLVSHLHWHRGTAEEQREDTLAAVEYIHDRFGHVPVIGLWVDENWEVSEVSG